MLVDDGGVDLVEEGFEDEDSVDEDSEDEVDFLDEEVSLAVDEQGTNRVVSKKQ